MSKYIFFIIIFYLISPFVISAKEITIPKIEVDYQKKDPHGQINQIEVISTQEEILIDISSEHGIGVSTISLIEGDWPARVTVRLHLAGLEGFSVTNGKIKMEKSHLLVNAYNKDGNIVNTRHLLDGGYYEIRLPSSLFEDGMRKITIHWIDFYR
ncbi:MAG TPA: hypothetical protein P5149_15585 [Candidatus Competibacteraceae bacterium]|nr:hypothetical protein [Candidatus Competibacteraceae bacterium]